MDVEQSPDGSTILVLPNVLRIANVLKSEKIQVLVAVRHVFSAPKQIRVLKTSNSRSSRS